MKSSDAKASKCHLKFFSRIIIFINLVYLSSVISLKCQRKLTINCHLREITELKYELDKNDHSIRKFQMTLRGFCI